MVNPVVLICTHQRVEITATNIRSLMLQSVVPKIVLVCSARHERDYFISEFPQVSVVAMRPNEPLGRKFQQGVELAKGLDPNPLIITGSDDILGAEFIKIACQMITAGNHFIGLKQWFVYREEKLYLYDYTPAIPLGTRAYSLEMLNAIKWNVFDSGKDRLLDDYGYHAAVSSGLKIKTVVDILKDGLTVVSVKGDWPMLNPYDKMVDHPNCKLVRIYADDIKRIL